MPVNEILNSQHISENDYILRRLKLIMFREILELAQEHWLSQNSKLILSKYLAPLTPLNIVKSTHAYIETETHIHTHLYNYLIYRNFVTYFYLMSLAEVMTPVQIENCVSHLFFQVDQFYHDSFAKPIGEQRLQKRRKKIWRKLFVHKLFLGKRGHWP